MSEPPRPPDDPHDEPIEQLAAYDEKLRLGLTDLDDDAELSFPLGDGGAQGIGGMAEASPRTPSVAASDSDAVEQCALRGRVLLRALVRLGRQADATPRPVDETPGEM